MSEGSEGFGDELGVQARPDLRATATRHWAPPGYGYGYGYPPYGYAPFASAAPSSSDTVLGGLSHLSVFFAPVLMPLIVWLVMRRGSPYSSRQAKQAFFFQLAFCVVQIILAVGLVFVYPSLLFGHGPLIVRSADGEFSLIYYEIGPYFVLWLIPISFSIIGAVKAFQGKPFHYPLLGWL